ncbi:hypothetical protein [Planctomicrobium sp. SH527]|uniref:hypothetical protein n=1 Tax=Planctomicrobium sp. SH527 TaxID=3448123 RepID=UPI003F5BDAB1
MAANTGFFTEWMNSLGTSALPLWQAAVLIFVCLLSVLVTWILRQSLSESSRWTLSEILLTLTGAIGVVLLRVPAMAHVGGGFDESLWIVGALTLQHDPRFWISFDGTTSGPLTVYPLLFPTLWGGVANYGFTRLFTAVIWIAITILLYASLKCIANRKVAAILIGSLFAVLGVCNAVDYVTYNGEHIPILCMTIAFWLLVRQDNRKQFTMFSCCLIGLLLGAAPLGKLQIGPLAFTLGLFALYIANNIKARAALILGALIPISALTLYLWRESSISDAWFLAVRTTLDYAVASSERTWLQRQLGLPEILVASIDTRVFFPLQFLLAFTGIFGLIEVWQQKTISKPFLLISFLMVGVAWLSVCQSGATFYHYLLLFILPLISWNALSWSAILSNLNSQRDLNSPWAYRHIFYATISLMILPVLPAIGRGSEQIPRDGSPLPVVWTTPTSEAISQFAGPSTRLTVWGHRPELYVQCNLASGTRYAYPHAMHVPWSNVPRHFELFLHDLKQQPDLIFVEVPTAEDSRIEVPPLSRFPELEAEIQNRFELKATIDGARIWVLKHPHPVADEPETQQTMN